MSNASSSAVGREQSFARNWAAATLLTGLTCVCARLAAPLPFTPVPITLQVFAVLLSGLLLGRRWGTVAQGQYLLLGGLGAPVFAPGHLGLVGFANFFGPTGGYLWAFPIATYVVGLLTERKDETRPTVMQSLLACFAGLGIIYGLGCGWLAVWSRPMLSPLMAVKAGAGWFLAWDIVKAMMAVAVASGRRR